MRVRISGTAAGAEPVRNPPRRLRRHPRGRRLHRGAAHRLQRSGRQVRLFLLIIVWAIVLTPCFVHTQRQHIDKLRVARAGRDGRRGGRPGDQGGTDARVHGRDVTHYGRRQGGGHRDALQVSAKLADELETLSDRSINIRIDVVTLTLYELTLIERFVSIRDTPAPSEDAGTCTATCPATAART